MIDTGLNLRTPEPEKPSIIFWRRFRRNKPALIGLIILITLIIASLAAPLLTQFDPEKQSLKDSLEFPSRTHLLGTDYLGRDMLTRLLYGGRISLMIGFLSVSLGLLIGVTLGAISGYFGGYYDLIIQRVADILLSFPSFLLALTLVAMLGVGLRNVIISVGILAIPSFIRLVRSSVLSVRETQYVEASRCAGAKDFHILRRHILPNSMGPVIINASLNLGYAISTAAGLGFLGLGVPPNIPEWGMMLGQAKNYIFSHPYMVTYSGLIIFITIISVNLIGDGLRDALDPRMRSY